MRFCRNCGARLRKCRGIHEPKNLCAPCFQDRSERVVFESLLPPSPRGRWASPENHPRPRDIDPDPVNALSPKVCECEYPIPMGDEEEADSCVRCAKRILRVPA